MIKIILKIQKKKKRKNTEPITIWSILLFKNFFLSLFSSKHIVRFTMNFVYLNFNISCIITCDVNYHLLVRGRLTSSLRNFVYQDNCCLCLKVNPLNCRFRLITLI